MTPIEAGGYGLDRAAAALFCGARRGETVSLMAAEARVNGKRWGCVMCGLLSVLVERHHCDRVLSDQVEAAPAMYRAGGLLLAALLALWWGVPLAVVWLVK